MHTNQTYEEKCTIEQPVEQIVACKDVHLEASDSDQLDRLINILKSNENFFVANSNDYFAYKMVMHIRNKTTCCISSTKRFSYRTRFII